MNHSCALALAIGPFQRHRSCFALHGISALSRCAQHEGNLTAQLGGSLAESVVYATPTVSSQRRCAAKKVAFPGNSARLTATSAACPESFGGLDMDPMIFDDFRTKASSPGHFKVTVPVS